MKMDDYILQMIVKRKECITIMGILKIIHSFKSYYCSSTLIASLSFILQSLSSVPPSCVAPNNISYNADNASPNISPTSGVQQQEFLRSNTNHPSSHSNESQQHALLEHPGPVYPISQHLQRYRLGLINESIKVVAYLKTIRLIVFHC